MRKILILAFVCLSLVNAQPATTVMAAITATRIMNALKSGDTGTANAYIGCDTYTTAPVDGLMVMLTPAHTNTGASTLNWCAAGAVQIQTNLGAAIAAGAIQANGASAPSHVLFVYSSAANGGAGAWGMVVGAGGAGGASTFQGLTDNQGSILGSIFSMAPGGVVNLLSATATPFAGAGTITVTGGSDTGTIGVGYNTSNQRVCFTVSGTITYSNYTISSGSGGFGGTCAASKPIGAVTTSTFTVVSGAMGVVTDTRQATEVAGVSCTGNLIVSGTGCMIDVTSLLTWTGIIDFTGAVTRPVQSGVSDPSTCTAGKDMFINTSGTPVLKLCTATNTWTAVAGGGSIALNGTCLSMACISTATAIAPQATASPFYMRFTLWTAASFGHVNMYLSSSTSSYVAIAIYNAACTSLLATSSAAQMASGSGSNLAIPFSQSLAAGSYVIALSTNDTTTGSSFANVYGFSNALNGDASPRFVTFTASNAASWSGTTPTFPSTCGTISGAAYQPLFMAFP